MQLKKILSLASVMLVVSQVNAAEPLKMEGKESLYQRVLTTAPCPLYANKTDTDGPLVPTFNQYYVYERDGDFVAVGNDTKGKIEGYLKTDCVIDWKMQSALMFESVNLFV